MVTFLANHIPNLANIIAPLRDLLKQDVPFEWSEDHQATFENIKKAVANSISLNYYDPAKPVTLEVDASGQGLGAVLIQDNRPVAVASKSPTQAQSNYSDI